MGNPSHPHVISADKDVNFFMGNASKVMYKIANVFNWIIAIFAILDIVFSILYGAGVMKKPLW